MAVCMADFVLCFIASCNSKQVMSLTPVAKLVIFIFLDYCRLKVFMIRLPAVWLTKDRLIPLVGFVQKPMLGEVWN
jgi:hypothetical protein